MTLVQNSAEGGTNGTQLTTANSGGGSGDAFTVVSPGSSARCTFDNTQTMHGSLSYKIAAAASTTTFNGWNGYTATTMAARFYFRFSALPSVAGFRLLDIRDSAAAGVGRVNMNASNQLIFQNNGSTLKTFTNALSANTWYRLEVVCGNNTAVYKCDYYLGDSTTPVETGFSNATQASGSTNTLAEVRFGPSASTTFASSLWLDDLGAQDGTTTYLGPAAIDGAVTAVAATATADAPAPAISADQNISGGGAATATAQAYAPTVTATQNPTVTAVVATASATAIAPTVTATRSATVTAVAATATAQAIAPAVSATRNATVAAVAATATALAPAPVVSAGGSATVSPPAATATAAALAPVVAGVRNATATAVVATASSAAIAPTVTGTSNATVTATRAIATAQAIAPTVRVDAQVTATAATATAAAIGPLVRVDATVLAIAATAQATVLLPTVIGTNPATDRDITAIATLIRDWHAGPLTREWDAALAPRTWKASL